MAAGASAPRLPGDRSIEWSRRRDARPGATSRPLADRARRLQPRLLDDVRRQIIVGGRLVGQRPAAVLLDADRHRLVAGAIEVREDRRRRRERHFVLARSAAVDDADAKAFHAERITGESRKRDAKTGSCMRGAGVALSSVTHTDGGARRGVLTHGARRRARRRRSCRSARTARSRRSRTAISRRSAPRSSSATPIICICGPATT